MGKEAREIVLPATVDATRNGYLRRVTEGGFRSTAEWIDRKFPKVSPHHVTLVGLGAVVLGTRIAEKEKRRPVPRKGVLVLAAGLKLTGYALDAVDGPLSKKKTNHNSDFGQLLDYAVDRIEESDAARSRARSSSTWLGEIAAKGNSISNTLPGIARAMTEEQGKVVPEHGRNIFEALGTRFGRVVIDMVATFFPQVQPAADILGNTTNVYSAGKRLLDSKKGDEVLSERKRKQANARKKVLTGVLFANTAAVFMPRKN